MSVHSVDYIKTEMNHDNTMNSSMFTFDTESLPFYDDREDACTQTYTTKSVSNQGPPDQDIQFDELQETDTTDISFYETCQFLCSPTVQTRAHLCWKDKTPKTVKMLKEKHRENERLRHHSLNQHLRLICKKVPGSAENGKETKVVMMQRIISYVAYLENTIRFMCSQLGVKSDPAWLKLTSSIKDMDKSETWRKEFTSACSEDSRDSEVFSRNISCRLKLSSPTVDTTTTCPTPSPTTDYNLQISEDACQEQEDTLTTTCSKDVDENIVSAWQWLGSAEEVVIDESENFDVLLNSSEYDHNVFEVPSSTLESRLMESPNEVKWLGSPEKSPTHPQEKSDSHLGIKCDPQYFDDQPCELSHTFTVSPDQVIPQTAVEQEAEEDYEASAVASSLGSFVGKGNETLKTRHKQKSNPRTPLFNVTNWIEIPVELNEELVGSSDWHYKQEDSGSEIIGSHFTEGDTSYQTNGMTKAGTTSGPNYAMAVHELEAECERILKDASGDMPAKLDLRKSSWMNGFMMYSHIHRKQLIRENPGLHISIISKMMGRAWRGMTSEQQNPYREQAQICSQGLHRIFKGT